MEIERKWMVQGWPQGLPLLETYRMDQGYISVRPTVRIRREALQGGRTALVLCFKGAPDKTGLMREEIETEITPELFEKLERLIGKPLIAKERRTYTLKNGLKLEVNDVDAGLPSHFMYAEVEYPDEPTARAWTPADDALTHYLSNECTGQPGARAEGEGEDDVDEQENAAAVLCCEIGETPDIAEAYRSACRREDKADLARKGASLVLIFVH